MYSENELFNPCIDVWGEEYREKLRKEKDIQESKNSTLYKLAGETTEIIEEKPKETTINIDLGNLVSNITHDIGSKFDALKNPVTKRPTVSKNIEQSPVSFRGSMIMSEEVPTKKRGRKKKDGDEKEEEIDERETVEFFEKRFEKPLLRITNIIEELDSKKNILEDEINELKPTLKTSRNGALMDYVGRAESNVIDLIKTKLSAVKEEVNVYTKISDLELKKSKNVSDAKGSTEAVMSKIYEGLMGGNNSSMPMLQGDTSMNSFYDSYLTPGYTNSDPVENALDNRYSDLMHQGYIHESGAERNLQYVNRDVKMVVIKSENSNSWRFAALDSISQQEIYDYSKPSVLGNMRFDEVKGIAYDNVNKYELIILPGEIESYEEIDYVGDFNQPYDY